MTTVAETAREKITNELDAGEQIQAVGQFNEIASFGVSMLSPILAASLQKDYYVGVTNQRLIFIQIGGIGCDNFSIPLTDIGFRSWPLIINIPGSPKPQKLYPNFGFKKFTGFDEKEFKAALSKIEIIKAEKNSQQASQEQKIRQIILTYDLTIQDRIILKDMIKNASELDYKNVADILEGIINMKFNLEQLNVNIRENLIKNSYSANKIINYSKTDIRFIDFYTNKERFIQADYISIN